MKWLGRIAIVLLSLVISPLMIWHAITTMKSPLYEGIYEKENNYVQNAAFVKKLELEDKGFHQGDIVLIELFSRLPLNSKLLEQFEQYRADYAISTGGIVLGPTNCPKISDEEIGLYLPFYGLSDVEIPAWLTQINDDPLCGQLIVTNRTSTSAYLVLVPPDGAYTRSFHENLANTLERVRPQGRWEIAWRKTELFLWKSDIEPVGEEGMQVFVTSFPLGEIVAEQGINQDVILKFPLSLVCFAGLYLMVSFRFLHHYYGPVLLSIFFTIEWTFGAIGLLTFFGFYHTVYSIIPLGGGASVMGLSFSVQRMDSLKALREERGEKATCLSMIIIMGFTILAFLLFLGNFAGLKRMQEIGMFFASAALIAWLTARFVLPCVFEWWKEMFGTREERDLWQWQWVSAEKLDLALAYLVEWLWQKNCALRARQRAIMHMVPILFFVGAAVLFTTGKIPTISTIAAFLPDGSKTEESFLRAQQGKNGYSPFQIMMSVSPPHTLTDVRVMEAGETLLEYIKRIEGMGMILSPLQSILYQRMERPLSDAVRIVEEGEDLVSNRLRSYLHTRQHALILAFHPMTDSKRIRDVLNALETFSKNIEEQYQDVGIKVRVWGAPALFVEMAERTVIQTPQNVLTSLFFIFGVYSAIVALLNGFHRQHNISPLWGGWILSQPFMLATGATGCAMAISGIPLNIATAPISEVAIAAAADFNMYLAISFLLFLYHGGLSSSQAMRKAFEEKAEVVIKDYIGNSLCFMLLTISSLQQVAELGGLMIINLFVCVAWGLLTTLPMLAANAEKRMEAIHDQNRNVFSGLRAASFLG